MWTRLILVTLLVLSNGAPVGTAHAERKKAFRSDDGTAVFYVDPKTYRRTGNLVKLWELIDFETEQALPDNSFLFSTKLLSEYDCQEERRRSLASVDYSDHMGNGKVVHTFMNETEWEPVVPSTMGLSLWKVACSKK